jgi:hypothetical protein
MFHSNNTGRQIVIVNNTQSQSWILATDYKRANDRMIKLIEPIDRSKCQTNNS